MKALELRLGGTPQVTAKAFFETACSILVRMDPERCRRIGGTYGFVLSGQGGGTWTVDLEELTVRPAACPADITLHASAADFLALLTRDLDGAQAANDGRLRVTGDPQLLHGLAAFMLGLDTDG